MRRVRRRRPPLKRRNGLLLLRGAEVAALGHVLALAGLRGTRHGDEDFLIWRKILAKKTKKSRNPILVRKPQ